MYAVSQEFLNQMKAPVRRVDARVTIDYTDPTQDQTIEVTASEQANASYPAQTADFVTEPTYKWAALDGTWVLDGTWHLAPVPEDAYLYQMGWWSAQVAGEDGRFSEPYPTLILTHSARSVTTFQVVGDSARGEWPTEFTVRLYGPDGSLLRERSVTGNTEIQFYELLDPPALDVTRQELEIRAWSHPGRHAKILEFFTSLQETYEGDDLVQLHLLEESESGNGVGTGGVSTNEITVRLVNRGGRFDVTNPQSPFRELPRPNRRVRAWLGIRGAGDLWGDGWYAPFDRDLAVARRDGAVLEPLSGYVATLRPGEGRFGGAVAVEEGTTNLANNPTFSGAVGTTPSGWHSDVTIQQDDFFGQLINVAELLCVSGNAYEDFGTGIAYPLAYNTTYTISFWARGTMEPSYELSTNRGIASATWKSKPPMSLQWQRYEVTIVTASSGSIYPFWWHLSNRDDVNVGKWVRIARIQLEEKPFATSFVDGTRAAGQLLYQVSLADSGTVGFWVNVKKLRDDAGWQHILNLGTYGSGVGRAEFVFAGDNSGRFEFAVIDGTNTKRRIQTQLRTEFVNAWKFVVGTWNSGTAKLYIDGQPAGQVTYTDPRAFIHLYIGSWIGNPGGTRAEVTNALFDELLILPYAASEEIIAELYRETRPLYDEWVPLGVFWSTDWDSEELEAMVRARDRMELLRRTTYEPGPLKQNVSLYELAQDVLTHAKMPPETYRLDPGLQDIVVPWGWVPPGSHRDALRIIAEAGLARAHCDRDGILRIERVTVPTGAPVLAITKDDYFPPARHPVTSSLVANRVVVTTQPLVPASSPEEVYRATVEVPAGQTIAVRAEYNKRPVIDAAASLESPPASVSIVEASYGAAGAEVQIRNTGASMASVTLAITGRPLSVEGGEQVVEEDDQSIRELGLIVHEVPPNPLVQTSEHARAIAQAILVRSAQQRRDVELEWRGNPALEVDDVVSVDGMQAQVVRQELSWAGALSARLVARRLD